MPLQYPSPYNPYQEPQRPANWPKIILIVLGILILAAIIYFIFFLASSVEEKADNLGQISYNCASDVYNCDDFTIQEEAQAVFDYCSEQGAGDVHGLDADGNGEACEGLG